MSGVKCATDVLMFGERREEKSRVWHCSFATALRPCVSYCVRCRDGRAPWQTFSHDVSCGPYAIAAARSFDAKNPPAAGPARAAAPNWASDFAAVQYEILNNKNIKILLFLIIFQSFIIIISNLVLEICKTLLT